MEKNEIKSKQVGKNLMVWIDDVRFVRTDLTKEEKKAVVNKVLLYNKTFNLDLKAELLSIMDKAKPVKEAKEAKVKGTKALIKKEKKAIKKIKGEVGVVQREKTDLFAELEAKANSEEGLSEAEQNQLQTLLNKSKKVQKVEEVGVVNSPAPHRGEY